jgi:hypothetical protein
LIERRPWTLETTPRMDRMAFKLPKKIKELLKRSEKKKREIRPKTMKDLWEMNWKRNVVCPANCTPPNYLSEKKWK